MSCRKNQSRRALQTTQDILSSKTFRTISLQVLTPKVRWHSQVLILALQAFASVKDPLRYASLAHFPVPAIRFFTLLARSDKRLRGGLSRFCFFRSPTFALRAAYPDPGLLLVQKVYLYLFGNLLRWHNPNKSEVVSWDLMR